ncbi:MULTISPECIES: hypothetical protein [unclassified Caulobacter]|uniref:hypothetical protein n=1 Tax=unclassified Caulobacter TaxID=2648921 RepID=UPI0011B63427|nr:MULTISPECIES: hypothetical protein [unclassified Caulobacter]
MANEYIQAWWGTWWPWAEANQGLLSVGALGLAMLAFMAETRRANKAEAEALRKERQADRRSTLERRRAAEHERRRQISDFADLVSQMTRDFVDACIEAVDQLETSDDQMPGLPGNWLHTAIELRESLKAILPSAPRDAELVLATHRIIELLRNAEGRQVLVARTDVLGYVRSVQNRLLEQLMSVDGSKILARSTPGESGEP